MWKFFVVLMLFTSVLAGCAAPAATPNDDASVAVPTSSADSTVDNTAIKVGGLFDRTGATSDVGIAYANGVQAYVDWLNSNGGIDGRPIDLIDADYAYKVENAERLYSQYVNTEKVVAIIGWGTGDTAALSPRLGRDHIPFMSGSLAETLTNVAKAPYNFVVGVTYSDQMRIVLQYLLQQRNNAQDLKVAFLYHDSPFGKAPEAALDAIAAANNLKVLKVAMPRGATDLTVQMREVQSFGPDYVVIQNTPGPASLALQNAKTLGLNTQFILLNFAANEMLIAEAADAANGVIGALPFAPPHEEVPAVKTINDHLQRKHQGALTDPDKGLVFSQGWTIMSVMAEGIRRAAAKGQISGETIRTELEGLQEFSTGGITAPITFGPQDHQGARALRLYQVRDAKWIAITDFIEAKQ